MITIDLQELKAAVKTLASAVNLKTETEHLQNVRLVAGPKGDVQLWATDLLVSAVIRFNNRSKDKGTDCLVPFEVFRAFISTWEGQEVNLTGNQTHVIMSCEGDEVELPKRTGLKEFVSHFPNFSYSGQKASVNYFPSYASLAYPVSIGKLENQAYSFNGIHVVVDKSGMTVEATDGFRYISLTEKGRTKIKMDSVIESKGGLILSTLDDGPGSLWESDRHVFFHSGNCRISVLKLGSAKFPDLSQIPRKKNGMMKLKRSELAQILKRAGIITNETIFLGTSSTEAVWSAKSTDGQYSFESGLRVMTKGTIPNVGMSWSHLNYLVALSEDELVLNFGRAKEIIWYEDAKCQYGLASYEPGV